MRKQLDKAINIHDVAREAEVSYQTVSRVLNHHPSVAALTRSRVEAAILRLDYRPNDAARNLASRRSTTLGVVSFGITHYGPAQIHAGLEAAARLHGYRLSSLSVEELSVEEIAEAIRALRAQGVAGIVLITPLLQVGSAEVDQLCAGLPHVLVDAQPDAGRMVASLDQFLGGRLAAQHLLTLGHQRIVLLGGPRDWYDASQRRGGWLSALDQLGLRPVAEAEGDWTASSGHLRTHELLATGIAFTALLVGNDQMALGAIRALMERGCRVPEDVSVVGFDDLPEAPFYAPPLTTVQQDFRGLGIHVIERLVDEIGGTGVTSGPAGVMPMLIIRGSTARRSLSVASPQKQWYDRENTSVTKSGTVGGANDPSQQ